MADTAVTNTTAQLSGKTLITAEGDWTITGLHTFSRGAAAPFAVAVNALKVSNLDADKVDGQDAPVGNIVGTSDAQALTNKTIVAGSNTITGITEAMQTLADNTTGNVSSSAHGYAPKSPGDATKFLSGASPSTWISAGYTTLLKANSGTDTTAAATNVDTVAISGLTALDTLLIVYMIESDTQSTAVPQFYNSTDSVAIVLLQGGNPLTDANQIAAGTCRIGQSQQTATRIWASALYQTIGSFATSAFGDGNISTFTQNWTGSWTLALRTGVGGVTAGGTFRWRWSVYKVAGQ